MDRDSAIELAREKADQPQTESLRRLGIKIVWQSDAIVGHGQHGLIVRQAGQRDSDLTMIPNSERMFQSICY